MRNMSSDPSDCCIHFPVFSTPFSSLPSPLFTSASLPCSLHAYKSQLNIRQQKASVAVEQSERKAVERGEQERRARGKRDGETGEAVKRLNCSEKGELINDVSQRSGNKHN